MTRSICTRAAMAAGLLAAFGAVAWDGHANAANGKAFERIATVEVWRNDPAAARSDERVAEIVDATPDGNTLVYSDSEGEQIGFYDITDPANPVGLGVFAVGGEPTSVATFAQNGTVYALVAINTSASFTNPSGDLLVIDISGVNPGDATNASLTMTLPMGGQPDSVAISPNGTYAAVAIENERDEDLESPALTPEEGGLPQLPAGFLNVVDLSDWSVHKVEMTGLAKFGGDDPEPEFVDINDDDIAVVTLQENNAVVLVDLASKSVVKSTDAGSVLLRNIDTVEDDVIRLTDKQRSVREPDAVTWMGGDNGKRKNRHFNNPQPFFATANEGDLRGGSRSFTIFDARGKVVHESQQSLEYRIVRHGHYPEGRSENKGGEPEGIEWAEFDGRGYLFVGAERAGVVAVYDVYDPGKPQFVQMLPTGLRPEGMKAIPDRGLFVVAAELDDAPNADNLKSAFRSVVSIYRLQQAAPSYPTVVSANQPFWPRDKRSLLCFHDKSCRDRPIPWGALSALAADRSDAGGLYAVSDSFYAEARIFAIDVGVSPAVIEEATTLVDGNGDPYPDLDPEGLVQRSDGSFWVVSEGSGSVDDPARPVTTTSRLLEVAADGTVLKVIGLPAEVNALQRRFGFEGVAATGTVGADETVYVAFQREWVDDPSGHVRIGVYDVADDSWGFFYYPIDAPSATFVNAWVGLSEIVSLGGGEFAVIERDNLIGEEAASEGGIKQICTFSVQGLTPEPQRGMFPTLTKSAPCTDLLPVLEAFNGPVMDKVEGLTVAADGDVYIVTDNDGVDDHPGETLLIDLGDTASVMP